MRSRKTTWAGIVAAVGLFASVITHAYKSPEGFLTSVFEPENAALITAALGAFFNGLFARDDDVTSEGTRAPKNSTK